MFLHATFAYLVAGTLAMRNLVADKPGRPAWAVHITLFAFLLHTGSLALAWFNSGRFPITSPADVAGFIAWCAGALFLISYFAFSRPASLTSFVLPVVILFSLISLTLGLIREPSAQPISNWWMAIHGVAILLGYAAFAFAFVVGIMYLIQERQLKAKSFGKLFRRLPSLDVLDKMNVSALALGFPLYTLAMAMAIVDWIDKHHSPFAWLSRPLGLLATLTWILYLVLVNIRFVNVIRGRKIAYLTILGFVLILLSLGLFFSTDNLHPNMGAILQP